MGWADAARLPPPIDAGLAIIAPGPAAEAESALTKLEAAARGTENLLPRILDCVEAQVTVGEISNRLRAVWGEYKETSTV